MTVTNLNIFQSGTLASVTPVNENFETLRVAVNTVEQSVTSNRSYLDGKVTELTESIGNTLYTSKTAGKLFCVNSGSYDEYARPSILTISEDVLSFNTPFTATNIEGKVLNATSISPVSIAGLADGTYNVFVDLEGTPEVIKNQIYRQPLAPYSPVTDDIWLDTSKNPLTAKKYTSNGWVDFLKIPVGYFVKASGAITTVITHPYEQNGYDVSTNSFYPFPDYYRGVGKTAGVNYIAEVSGWLYIYANAYAENKTYTVYLNGHPNTIGHGGLDGSAYGVGNAIMLPIAKGCSYGFVNVQYATFYPVKTI